MLRIDVNSDLGESFGAWKIGDDEAVLPHITSANIACGFHAGDPTVMRATVAAALRHGVALGAHPGHPDLIGFGRRELAVTPQEAYDMVVYQVGALDAFARAAGARLQHVKPHGALYNQAVRDPALAGALARAVADVSRDLIFFGLSGSVMIDAAARAGLETASEVFADRHYLNDGSLAPRGNGEGLIHDISEAVDQVVRMVREGVVVAVDGSVVPVRAETVCIHGDKAGAVELARTLRRRLGEEGVEVRAWQ